MSNEHYEIERKYLIRRPDPAYLEANGACSEILQTYLLGRPGETARVRKRWDAAGARYYHTVKTRLSAVRRIERESEIGETEYEELLKTADPSCTPIRKQRWLLPYRGQLFEIDVFPFWKRQAFLELELRDESQEIDFPPALEIIREVTEDRRYTNRALAREIPEEEV